MTDPLQTIAENITAILVAEGVGESSTGAAYTPGAVAIVPGQLPTQPDRAIAVNVTSSSDNITLPDGNVIVELYVRGAPNQPYDAGNISWAIFDAVHGLTQLDWGTVKLTQIYRQLSLSNGSDAAKRQERVEHYYADVGYPATINRPDGGSW